MTYLLILFHVVPAALSVYHLLLYKRDPRSAMAWIIVCLFIPYAGPAAYFLFGINRVRSRAYGLKRRVFRIDYEATRRLPVLPDPAANDLKRAGSRITGRHILGGNDITPLYNGDSVYPAMLESIAGAKSQVLLATFILKTDQTGRMFADALAAAVQRGVRVLVLVDGIGELYSFRKATPLLRKRGVETARFLPPKLLPPSIYINLRNHRKLLIVDQQIAYAGGMNISDDHVATDKGPMLVSDVHFRLLGPVVDELAGIFATDWRFATGAAIDTATPPAAHSGDMRCRLVPDGPDEGLDALALTIQTAISCAIESIDIMTPYFLPSRELIAALQSAALRGVRTRIVLPGKNNLFYVHWAHRNCLAELLPWDIEIYYQPAPFCHSKLICIDRGYALIGSANLDPRSLRLNFELGIEVFSTRLNTDLRNYIESTITASARFTSADLEARPIGIRLRDSAAALLTPYI